MAILNRFFACPCSKGYTDQQLIAGRAIKAAYNLLQWEWESYSQSKESRSFRNWRKRHLCSCRLCALTELENRAELTLMGFRGSYSKLFVRPEHLTTSRSVTFMEEPTDRLPLCSVPLRAARVSSLAHGDHRNSFKKRLREWMGQMKIFHVSENSRRLELSISENTPHGRWGQGPGSVDPRFPACLPFPVPEILEFVAFRDSGKFFQQFSGDFPGLFLQNPWTDLGNSHSLLGFSECGCPSIPGIAPGVAPRTVVFVPFESKLLPAVLLLLKIYFPKITVTVTVLKFGWITITVTVLAPTVTPSFPLIPNYRLESHLN